MTGFCNHLTKLPHLGPEIVFDVTAHWYAKKIDLLFEFFLIIFCRILIHIFFTRLAEPKDQICIHLKSVESRKQVGPRILAYLCQFLPKILYNEINKS